MAAGGAAGSAMRYLVGVGVVRAFGIVSFPVATFAVNLVGSILLGVMLETFATKSIGTPGLRLALTTGVMGGFTTYSTFNLETQRLLAEGRIGLGIAYVLATVLICLGATAAGIALVRA